MRPHLGQVPLPASMSLVLLALALWGCAGADPRLGNAASRERGPAGTFVYLVRVEASEPGVRIEADGDMVGTTPLTLRVFGDKDGTFHNFGRPDYLVRAYPARPGQSPQTKVFGTGAWFGREDRIPSMIYFDMSQTGDTTGAAPRVEPSSNP